MAAIFAQVGGDAVSASGLGHYSRANGIGIITSTGIANGCHVIDVDAKAQFISSHRNLQLGSITSKS